MFAAMAELTRPPGMEPGIQKTPGTRIPPSQVVALPNLKGPAEPASIPYWSQGPLSDVYTTSVRRSRPRPRSLPRIWPTDQSSSSITSP